MKLEVPKGNGRLGRRVWSPEKGPGPWVAVLGPPFKMDGPESVTLIPFPSPEAPKPLHQAWLPFWGRAAS